MLFSGGAVAAPLETGFPSLWPAGTPSPLCSSAPAILNCSLLLELTVLSGGFIRKLRILQFQDSFQGPRRASSNFTFKILCVLFCFVLRILLYFPSPSKYANFRPHKIWLHPGACSFVSPFSLQVHPESGLTHSPLRLL